ncbi:MAG: RHS repeat-associated core domain-containing protein [Chthonomonas sp.]|nr:RHS repeat-associated core domain-containing protein [Chthonomonas sp.]
MLLPSIAPAATSIAEAVKELQERSGLKTGYRPPQFDREPRQRQLPGTPGRNLETRGWWSGPMQKSYVYDKASFVKEHTVGSNTTEYTYDDAGQLIREEKPWLSWDREYEYDGNGNRKKHFHNAAEYRNIYDPGDRLKEIQESDIYNVWTPIREFTYDAAGRMATDTEGNRGFTWDHEGRLTGLTATAGNSYNSYNGLNTRISHTATGTTTFTRDGVGVTSPLMRDSAGTAYTPNVSYRSGGNTKFQHYGLKNTQYETSTTPAVTADSEFDAFGDALSPFSTGGLFGYGGAYGYQSDSSGLQLLGHRWYDPTIGRFISKDPQHDGGNWYAYCDNNPIGRADPKGLISWPIVIGFAVVAVAWAVWEIKNGNSPGNAATNAGTNVAGYIVPSPGGELAGAAQAAAPINGIAEIKKAEKLVWDDLIEDTAQGDPAANNPGHADAFDQDGDTSGSVERKRGLNQWSGRQ